MFTPNVENPAYFVTIDVYRGTKIFEQDNLCEIILKSWEFCEEKYAIEILNYVIMPEHLHFIFYFKDGSDKINKRTKIGLRGKYNYLSSEVTDDFIKNFKKFTAHEILKVLKSEKSEFLQRLVLKKEKKRAHYYSVWLEDKHVVLINDLDHLYGKQKYVHDNPIRGKLVKDIKDYKYIK